MSLPRDLAMVAASPRSGRDEVRLNTLYRSEFCTASACARLSHKATAVAMSWAKSGTQRWQRAVRIPVLRYAILVPASVRILCAAST